VTLPVMPIYIVDLYGSLLMIIFAFLSIRQVKRLRSENPQNVVWIYLLWLCYGLAGFAVSRSVGHIVKRVFITSGHEYLWLMLRPYSGAVNTIMFVVVASITLFFERIWKIYEHIMEDRRALKQAHEQLLYLNKHLEDLVTERTKELALSERKYRRLFEISRDMIAIVEWNGRVLSINPAGLCMLGWGDEDVKVKFFQDCFFNEEDFREVWKRLKMDSEVKNYECSFIRSDGLKFEVLVTGSVEVESERQMLHFWVKDISQRKNMERKLIQADKLASLGQLAAGVAHEINNPLGIILGYTQLLLRQCEEGSEVYDDLKVIERHVRNCKTIVGDLLKFARSAPTQKGEADIHEAITEVLAVVKHQFMLDGVAIKEKFDHSIPRLHWDINKMKQVFMNLLMNARQAIGKNRGLIEVETRLENGNVIIKVSDTGCGIPPENLPRVFDPFFTTKPTGQGTGLGLSVSYGIITEHGGTISVDSEPGKGTVFTLTFPIKEGMNESYEQ